MYWWKSPNAMPPISTVCHLENEQRIAVKNIPRLVNSSHIAGRTAVRNSIKSRCHKWNFSGMAVELDPSKPNKSRITCQI